MVRAVRSIRKANIEKRDALSLELPISGEEFILGICISVFLTHETLKILRDFFFLSSRIFFCNKRGSGILRITSRLHISYLFFLDFLFSFGEDEIMNRSFTSWHISKNGGYIIISDMSRKRSSFLKCHAT